MLMLAIMATAVVAKPLNLLLIVADDLGWNDVDWHGSTQIPTPHLSKLASEGVTLNNYYVQPVCSPTRASILTGRHVIHTGVYDPDCSPKTTLAVPFNFSMLPAPLSKLGYESHAIGKWHLGMFSRRVVPTGKGFASFLGYYAGAQDYFNHTDAGANDMHHDVGSSLQAIRVDEYSTHLYTRHAIRTIEGFAGRQSRGQNASQSLFLYLAYQAIHSPDQVPDEYRDRFTDTIPDTPDGVGQQRRTVAGMVACLDEGVGNITAALHEVGMLDDTLIVFTTDNGGPAAGFSNNMASNWPLRGMKRTLWQGGVRASGFVHGAGLRKTGYVSQGLMHAADWFPTLLSAAKQAYTAAGTSTAQDDWRSLMQFGEGGEPEWQLGDGVDVWDMLSRGTPSPRSEVLIEAHPQGQGTDDGNGQAIIVGELKLILEKGPQWHGPPNDLWYASGSNPELYNHTLQCGAAPVKGPLPPCLFNLTADPCEYQDLKDVLPEAFAELRQRLAAYQATAVPASFHQLPMCNHPTSPLKEPVNGTWMPVCP